METDMAALLSGLNPRLRRVAKRIHSEFYEMPGMRLTDAQVRRLLSLSPQECEDTLGSLCGSRHFAHDPSGCYLLSAATLERATLHARK